MRRPGGFTLLEVLIAVTVLGTAIVGSAVAVRAALSTANHARLAREAVDVARRELALSIIADADNLQDRSSSAGRYQWQVSYVARPLGLVMAKVRVSWNEQGSLQTYQLAELFTPRRPEEAAP